MSFFSLNFQPVISPNEFIPYSELNCSNPTRLAGRNFNGIIIDPNFWTYSNTANATHTQANLQLTSNTGYASNGNTAIQSKQYGRFIDGAIILYRGMLKLPLAPNINNTRRFGAFTTTNGIYFKLTDGLLNVASMRNSIETSILLSNCNRCTNIKPELILTNYNTYEIYWINKNIYFTINGELIHVTSIVNDSIVSSTNLPIRMDNINSNNEANNITMSCISADIFKIGNLPTNPISFRLTTAGTYILKYGSGMLTRVTISNPTDGTTIGLYDSVGTSETTEAIINLPSKASAVSLEYGIQFNIGLTVVSTGTWDASIVYE